MEKGRTAFIRQGNFSALPGGRWSVGVYLQKDIHKSTMIHLVCFAPSFFPKENDKNSSRLFITPPLRSEHTVAPNNNNNIRTKRMERTKALQRG